MLHYAYERKMPIQVRRKCGVWNAAAAAVKVLGGVGSSGRSGSGGGSCAWLLHKQR